jgi:putative hemolysin
VVREVMKPRPDMIAIDASDSIDDAMEIAIKAGYSRIPVIRESKDDIAGIVYAKDMMRAQRDGKALQPVAAIIRPARFAPESKRVSELMREMQAQKFHMAIVLDEYGGTAGLVTLEDLIEELIGEIVDEYDVEEAQIERLPDGDVRVTASMLIDELNELLDVEWSRNDWDTVGGLVFNRLGHVPHEGETVDYEGHRLRAERVKGRRIGRVRITRLPDDGEEAEEQ